MSIGQKSSNTQLFRLMAYQRALHPELFDLQVRQSQRLENYEFECWLMPAGHVVRFQAQGQALTETVIERGDHLPEKGLVHALPCIGEKEYERQPQPQDKIGYVTTVQTETLTENLYMATYREMCDFAHDAGAMAHRWTDKDGVLCLSLLDTQKYKRELHVQSYHLTGVTGLVLRTQSIFEVL